MFAENKVWPQTSGKGEGVMKALISIGTGVANSAAALPLLIMTAAAATQVAPVLQGAPPTSAAVSQAMLEGAGGGQGDLGLGGAGPAGAALGAEDGQGAGGLLPPVGAALQPGAADVGAFDRGRKGDVGLKAAMMSGRGAGRRPNVAGGLRAMSLSASSVSSWKK
jgi:hypothetical protein